MKKRFTSSIEDDELRIVMTGKNPSLNVKTLTDLKELIENNRDKRLIISSLRETFCAGLDLRTLLKQKSARESLQALFRLYEALVAHPKPTICLVSAPVIGGGVGLALCTDVLVMSCNASFSLPEPLPYRPLAEALFPVASIRKDVTRTQFDKWYGNATSAHELENQEVADRVVHTTEFEVLRACALEVLQDESFDMPNGTMKKLPEEELEPLVAAAIDASEKASFSVEAQLSLREIEPSGVFVVHGRNHVARDAVIQLVESIGMEWRDLHSVEFKYSTSDSLWETVYIGIRLAKAVIVLFTPDETAQLQPDHGDEAAREQSRPNVFLEAGLALGMRKDRTILLQVQPAKRPSDLQGHFWIDADDPDDWRELVERKLRSFGCQCKKNGVKRPTQDSIRGK